MSNKLVVASLLSIGLIAGCTTTAQGPTFNVYQIQTANGTKAYRAECHGLVENVSACVAAAQKVCGDQPAYKLDTMERLRAPNEEANDPRIVTFQCGAPQVAAPAPAPEPAPQPAPEMPRQINLSGDANFATDSASLTPKATATLDQFIEAGQNVTFRSVTVAGYTDSTGSASHNQQLSERRAQSVLSYLKSHGLRSQSYAAQGFGASNPVASNATTAGRAQNRRVEVRVSTQQ
ncbi:membrane protein [Caballeronia choica]|jgi:OmpA-OmpF porin, OOP family|uniref:Membrane protein n=1 Tax=Caballeronia choica TaxID=326476 RepID=A0A158IKA9_9BURK|nr:OmpA family protein [Caballeronia choica]SAL56994.1 membrane protein [Caballeronia choica]